MQPDTHLPKTPAIKTYKAILSQNSTNAPTATIIQNTLGGTLTWTRNSIGYYLGTLANAFTNTNVIVTPFGNENNGVYLTMFDSGYYTSYKNDDNSIFIGSYSDLGNTPMDISTSGAEIYIEINAYTIN